MPQGRPKNIADPNELFDWISTVLAGDGTGLKQAGTLTAIPATTVDGTYDANEAAVINAIRVTVNQIITQLNLKVA